MAIFAAGGNINSGAIAAKAVQVCSAIRNDLATAQELYAWLSAQSQEDLEALGLTATDYSFIMNAMADANAVAQIYSTGQPPESYPQAGSAYTYASSMRQIIGQG